MKIEKLKIGIIGAGFIARAVGQLAVKNGHEVMLSNSRGPQTLGSTRASVGCKVGTVAEAQKFGDIVIVAIPLSAYRSIPAEALVGKIVLDANNYYPGRDGVIAELERHSITTSELLAKHLQGARVVKAFNSILARDIEKDARPSGSPERRALPIAGDDVEAKRIATAFHDRIGFDVVDAGVLSEGRRFERARPCYCKPFDKAGLKLALEDTGPNVAEGSWRN